MTDELRCSARGCLNAATYELVWNNPKVHTPDRRKIWLACDEHEESLRKFLSARDFWIESLSIRSDAF